MTRDAHFVAPDDDQVQRQPTERLERMVESIDTSRHLVASLMLLERRITRSMMGLPYLDSPIWK